MTFKVKLPDDRYLEISVRDEIEDEPHAVTVPIEEIEEPEPAEMESEPARARRARRMARMMALGAFAGGALLLARSMRRRTRGSSMDVEIQDEEELTA